MKCIHSLSAKCNLTSIILCSGNLWLYNKRIVLLIKFSFKFYLIQFINYCLVTKVKKYILGKLIFLNCLLNNEKHPYTVFLT